MAAAMPSTTAPAPSEGPHLPAQGGRGGPVVDHQVGLPRRPASSCWAPLFEALQQGGQEEPRSTSPPGHHVGRVPLDQRVRRPVDVEPESDDHPPSKASARIPASLRSSETQIVGPLEAGPGTRRRPNRRRPPPARPPRDQMPPVDGHLRRPQQHRDQQRPTRRGRPGAPEPAPTGRFGARPPHRPGRRPGHGQGEQIAVGRVHLIQQVEVGKPGDGGQTGPGSLIEDHD